MPTVNPIPEDMHTVTPHLICAGAAAAIEFYQKAFNAVELMRIPGQNGRLMHACIRIGNSNVMLVDEMPEWGALSPKSLPPNACLPSVQAHPKQESFPAPAGPNWDW